MSMIFLTDELKEELYPIRRDKYGYKLNYQRLNVIKRTSINFFHAYSELPLGQEISLLEPFQDLYDIHNELRGILIKPLVCDYLVAKHSLALGLELSFLALNLLTLSLDKVPNSLQKVLEESLVTVGYAINMAITDATVVPIFVIRFLATIVNGLLQLITPSEQNAAFLNSGFDNEDAESKQNAAFLNSYH